jgi:hypothetical protein
VNERRAVVQHSHRTKYDKPAGTIAWWEHEEAWLGYRRKYPGSAARQDAQKIHDRAGFGYGELVEFLGHEPTTWQPRARVSS